MIKFTKIILILIAMYLSFVIGMKFSINKIGKSSNTELINNITNKIQEEDIKNIIETNDIKNPVNSGNVNNSSDENVQNIQKEQNLQDIEEININPEIQNKVMDEANEITEENIAFPENEENIDNEHFEEQDVLNFE